MTKILANPLSPVVICLLVADLVMAAWLAIHENLVFVTVVPLAHAIGVSVFYFRDSPRLVPALFWSTVPIFPIYLVSATVTSTTTFTIHAVVFTIWSILLVTIRCLDSRYVRFLAARKLLE